ncbi:MAG: hypothetical protein HY914_10635 [Desulfomonile tiedjei]|nr:hypothetical protein [Desulfomonile tiedjei]
MSKLVVDAKQVLEDLQSGMSDSALMVKYKLSPLDLEKLIEKLVELGVVRELSVKDLLRDVRSGVTHSGLMKKYKLTRSALERLLNEMTNAGISLFREREARDKKRISVSDIIRDVRAGLSETELMRKYELSSRGLQSTFWKLVRSGALTWHELLSAYPDLDSPATPREMRHWVRGYPILSIKVYDEGNPQNRGKVRDLTEKGLGVAGVLAEVGQQKTFVVVPDECTNLKPFRVRVECKWFLPTFESSPCAAGFEITGMDVDGFERLQELVQVTTLMFD